MFSLHKYNHRRINSISAKGFTLVELLVSVAIFAIVMTVATGTLVVLVDANTKSQSLLTATSNLSFALDSMTRDIRTGRYYYCATAGTVAAGLGSRTATNDCLTGGNHFVYTDGTTGGRIGYRLNQDLAANPPYSRVEKITGSGGSWVAVTSNEIFITDFSFVARATTPGNGNQALVEVYLEGYVQDGVDTETDFRIHTVANQRLLNL